MTLIGTEDCLYTCVMSFLHTDSEIVSVDVVKLQLSRFVVAVIIFMCSACTEILIYQITFFYCLLPAMAKVESIDKNEFISWRRVCSP